jgi:hypothetical protein
MSRARGWKALAAIVCALALTATAAACSSSSSSEGGSSSGSGSNGDTTGISGDTIKIGIASPAQAASIMAAADAETARVQREYNVTGPFWCVPCNFRALNHSDLTIAFDGEDEYGHYENGACFYAHTGFQALALSRTRGADAAFARMAGALENFESTRFWSQRFSWLEGVPMGADLKPGSGAPKFMISALKDPMGANLDRVQVVKGWVDTSGKLQEKVFDVVWGDADKRRKAANGKVTKVGDTVNIAKASYTNSIGDPELRTVWTDPEFNRNVRAFYYVRVIEIPTPRWVLFDALRYGAKLLPGTELKAQERAYSSPIWYNPKKAS